ncbi:Unknown protein [Striga hermonthica]|uniref:RING-type domain-containing protein n=1 Tax=Striga hermonthica TaxID=68872 RepID=A0A9N7NIQ2_STRHE|nr:Unknown protein [Striga hermonthica]
MDMFSFPGHYIQVRRGLEYDIHHPETFLFKFLSCHGVNDEVVIKKWVQDTKDIVNQLRHKAFVMTRSDLRVYPITMHIKLYTKQADNETIDDARWRAIMPNSSHVELGDKLIKLLSTPPPYKFPIELKNDAHQMNCGTCSGKLRFLNYILFLPCSHAYHYSCIAHWAKGKIQCQVCLKHVDFQTLLQCAVLRTRDSDLN